MQKVSQDFYTSPFSIFFNSWKLQKLLWLQIKCKKEKICKSLDLTPCWQWSEHFRLLGKHKNNYWSLLWPFREKPQHPPTCRCQDRQEPEHCRLPCVSMWLGSLSPLLRLQAPPPPKNRLRHPGAESSGVGYLIEPRGLRALYFCSNHCTSQCTRIYVYSVFHWLFWKYVFGLLKAGPSNESTSFQKN